MSTKNEWFDKPNPTGKGEIDEAGLRFTCTQCGNCCTGPTGFVLFTDLEAQAMAKDVGVSTEVFYEEYTRDTIVGRSLKEVEIEPYGFDCVFLTRDAKTGKTGCSVYQTRPEQCRTWPFWKSNLIGKRAWRQASEDCPGMDQGELHPPEYIRLTRDRVDI